MTEMPVQILISILMLLRIDTAPCVLPNEYFEKSCFPPNDRNALEPLITAPKPVGEFGARYSHWSKKIMTHVPGVFVSGKRV